MSNAMPPRPPDSGNIFTRIARRSPAITTWRVSSVSALVLDRLLRLAGHMLVEHDLAVEHVVDVGCADGLEIGAVDPLQLARAGHAPGREGRLAQHFQERHRIARHGGAGLLEAGAGAGFLEALDGRVGDPENGARGGRASVGFEETARRPDDGERERRAFLAKLLQSFPKGCVLSGAVARFEIGQAFEDPHGRADLPMPSSAKRSRPISATGEP